MVRGDLRKFGKIMVHGAISREGQPVSGVLQGTGTEEGVGMSEKYTMETDGYKRNRSSTPVQ